MADEDLDIRPVEAAPQPFQLATLTPHIRATEAKYGLPSGLLDRMIQQESGGNPDAVSPKGALGLLQIMPNTARELGVDPRDPAQAVEGAAKYLARLNKNYAGDWARTLAAYNWGPGNLANYGMDKMPEETRNYVAKLTPQGAAAKPGPRMPPAVDNTEDLDIRPVTPVAAPAAPASEETLDERMALRADLEAKDEALRVQEQQLTRQWQRGNAPMASAETRERAKVAQAALEQVQKARAELKQQIDKTGVGSTGRTIGGIAGGVLGSIAGGSVGAPTGLGAIVGATAGGAAGTAAGSALGTKVDIEIARRNSVQITPEQALKMIGANALEDVLWDVGGSLLFLGAGKAYRVVGDRKLLGRLRQELLDKVTGKRAGIAEKQASAAAAELFDEASIRPGQVVAQEGQDAVNRAEAVRELTKRTGGVVPTPGQVSGQAGQLETSARATHPEVFAEGQKALDTAAEGFRRDIVNPRGNPSSTQIGQGVVDMLGSVKTKVQTAAKPAFEAAKNANMHVNMVPYERAIDAILERDAKSGFLKSGERAWLQEQKQILTRNFSVNDAEGTIDTLSAMKARIRGMTAEGAPSTEFKKMLGDFVPVIEKEYEKAALQMGHKKMYDDLILARDAYSDMMGKVFDDEMETAMKRSPEDVGKLLWQRGHVSGPNQLHEVQKLAITNKVLTRAQVDQMNEDILRGFLATAVPNPKAAAGWSQALASDPAKRETFEALTRGPGGQKLKQLMEVMEQAAIIAGRGTANDDFTRGALGGVTQRVAHGNLGLGYATGFISLPLVALGMSISGMNKLLAKIYTTADKGLTRDLMLVLKAGPSVGNAAARGPVRAAVGRLSQWASENGVDLFQTNPEVEPEEQE